jgi:HAD superfamily phosphoserine phosphatase-like hydrolase
MVDVYLDTVKNTAPKLISHIARKVVEQNYERVYTYTRDKLRWHQKQGHKVIAISGSPIELVREMAERYKMDDTRRLFTRSAMTASIVEHSFKCGIPRSKRVRLLEMAERVRLDLNACFAYGDTAGDILCLIWWAIRSRSIRPGNCLAKLVRMES